MLKKEHYRNNLPHYQKPDQCYLITWCLKDAVPKHALKDYTEQMELLRTQIDLMKEGKTSLKYLKETEKTFYLVRKKYLKAFDALLTTQKTKIDLSQSSLTEILIAALDYWEGKRIQNFAYCIMPNHIHWVVAMHSNDENDKLVYLQDVLHSVKSYSANAINKVLKREGTLWHSENFDTTIRNEKHFMNAVNYTVNNPVGAGFVKYWQDWEGTKLISLNF